MTGAQRLRGLGLILVTAIFIAAAASVGDLWQAVTRIFAVAIKDWLTLMVVFAGVTILRWLRLVYALNVSGIWQVFQVSTRHVAAVAVLPGKSGELALPAELRRVLDVNLLSATSLLFILRLYDLLILLMSGALLFSWRMPIASHAYLSSATFIGSLFLAAVLIFLPWLLRMVRSQAVTRLVYTQPALRFLRTGRTAVPKFTVRRHGWVLSCTVGVWLAIGLACWLATRAVGLDVGLGLAGLAGVAASLAFALPVQGLANVGPFEAAFAAVLTAAGHAPEPAVAAALLVHGCGLAAALLAAAVSTVPIFPTQPSKQTGR